MAYNIKDMTHINWDKSIGSGLGSMGCYYKTKIVENGTTYYYKLSSFDSQRGFYGHESVNEVIISRLCKILGIPCAEYKLVKIKVKIRNKEYVTFACKSKSYKFAEDTSISFEDYYELNSVNENIIQFINTMNMDYNISTILILDFIIINRDRHGANIEILKNKNGERFAPLFDNGLSFCCSITQDLIDYKQRLKDFNTFTDTPVNNYIGSRSLLQNLNLIEHPVFLNKLTKNHKRNIFFNLSEAIPKEYIDKIWEIIVYRYSFLRKRGLIIEIERTT